MADRKRKRMVQQQPDRRANRTILVRTLFLLTLFGVAAFVPLLVRLWQIQIRDYDNHQRLAVEHQTADSTVEANRGTIYDRSGGPSQASSSPRTVLWSVREKRSTPPAAHLPTMSATRNSPSLLYSE